MTRYTASEARRQLFQLLDAAQRGEEVILDRKGVRFRLLAEPAKPIEPPPSPFVIADADLLSGEWTWVSDDMGQLQFMPTDDASNLDPE